MPKTARFDVELGAFVEEVCADLLSATRSTWPPG